MRWLRNQVIAPLTEELVFRACMLPMLAPCTGLGPAVFTCPLFFGVAHFHHIFEQLRFRQNSVGSIFLSAGWSSASRGVLGARAHRRGRENGDTVCSRAASPPATSPRTPDRAGSLSLLLQLHGLPRGVRGPGASAEAAAAGRLRPGRGTLPAPAAAPHGPQALRQPPALCALGAGGRRRGPSVLLTPALLRTPTDSHGLPGPPQRGGLRGTSLAGAPEISGIFVGDGSQSQLNRRDHEEGADFPGRGPRQEGEAPLGTGGPPAALGCCVSEPPHPCSESCSGVESTKAPPQFPRVFSLSFCIRTLYWDIKEI
ncbi:PREDICTED: CAAX prenyl protease 2 isoform X2 [Condylura cristata]|nr:PREDICTED: CAAX prenyl protease 2 isoform X2 [Condylura cristata]